MHQHTHLIIMAGGNGQRFWPWSTRTIPKQFHDFLSTGKTLLQATTQRFESLVSPHQMWVVTHHSYVELVRTQLPWIDPSHILVEPQPRNTAVCLAQACAILSVDYPQAQLIVTPADHVLKNNTSFCHTIEKALLYQQDPQALTLLGSPCPYPATGYGYIGYDGTSTEFIKPITHFVEKPTYEQAKTLLKAGNHLWNMGIFMGSLPTFIHNFQTYLPTLWQNMLQACTTHERGSREYQQSLAAVYDLCDPCSFDERIVTKASHRYVVAGDWGWSDLGTWSALYDHLPQDQAGNACLGSVVATQTQDCLVKANPGQLIVTYGVDDLVIVQHGATTLVCPKHKAEQLKSVITRLEEQGYSTYL